MLRIEDETGAWFAIRPLERLPENRILVDVGAGSRWFQGSFATQMDVRQIEDWVLGLEKLSRDLAGAYRLDTWERFLEATFAMGKRGDVAISARLQNHPDLLHELRLVIGIDQSSLPEIVDQIRSLRDIEPGRGA